MTNIVIIGGSFGGLTTAYELRRKLSPHQATITLIAKDKEFIFVPSLPWVAMGSRKLSQISFDLAKPLNQKQVRFVHETLVQIDHEKKKVTTDKSEYQYDFLIIATGHRSANEAVEGLGPFGGPGHSLMSATETEELGNALKKRLQDPGPVVIGYAPGARCIGLAYEFLF
jgi:sulfide:quinone oxidoreductase